ncbi:hypothetical protein G9P44_002886 [Scheffersomyces stipitis]|nr:hypothetical protein G9P44_002886 [Scheffersomyces stipitis]
MPRRPSTGTQSDTPALHVVPSFYGVYLLQSEPKPSSFYIGSTPDPPRRLRQHNGDLKAGGAYRTKRAGFRPWRMLLVVYDFPSKVSALQFEHSFQHCHETRHIKQEERISKNKLSGRTLHHKVANVALLLRSSYFRHLPLKVLVFEEAVYNSFMNNKFVTCSHVDLLNTNFNEYFSVMEKDVQGNETIKNATSQLEAQGSQKSQLDSTVDSWKTRHTNENEIWSMAKEAVILGSPRCALCLEPIEQVPETSSPISKRSDLQRYLQSESLPLVTMCYNPQCRDVFHLSCLGHRFTNSDGFQSLIPATVNRCCSCNAKLEWRTLAKIATKLRYYVLKDSLQLPSQVLENDDNYESQNVNDS